MPDFGVSDENLYLSEYSSGFELDNIIARLKATKSISTHSLSRVNKVHSHCAVPVPKVNSCIVLPRATEIANNLPALKHQADLKHCIEILTARIRQLKKEMSGRLAPFVGSGVNRNCHHLGIILEDTVRCLKMAGRLGVEKLGDIPDLESDLVKDSHQPPSCPLLHIRPQNDDDLEPWSAKPIVVCSCWPKKTQNFSNVVKNSSLLKLADYVKFEPESSPTKFRKPSKSTNIVKNTKLLRQVHNLRKALGLPPI